MFKRKVHAYNLYAFIDLIKKISCVAIPLYILELYSSYFTLNCFVQMFPQFSGVSVLTKKNNLVDSISWLVDK